MDNRKARWLEACGNDYLAAGQLRRAGRYYGAAARMAEARCLRVRCRHKCRLIASRIRRPTCSA